MHRGTDSVVIDPVLDYDARSGHIATDSARHLLAYVVEHRGDRWRATGGGGHTLGSEDRTRPQYSTLLI